MADYVANYVVMIQMVLPEEEDCYDIEHVCNIANSLIDIGNVEIDGTRKISVRPLSEVLPC